LAALGPLLDEPHTRQLDGKLREFRLFLGSRSVRITYWIAPGRRIILLTTFGKTRKQERHEVDQARRAMQTCIEGDHTLDED
jgi:hypothetical protein